MDIDHIFIFSSRYGEEAEELVKFGFTEGSSRTHKGQGTANRKFYFENFFLEILWVVDEAEIMSPTTSVTKLWDRSQFEYNGFSPFGLCLMNTKERDQLFEGSSAYQPDYFPKGMSIDIITNQDNPCLPWTFRLPFRGDKKAIEEPTHHINGIKSLTKVEFVVPSMDDQGSFVGSFENDAFVKFETGEKLFLVLEFDHQSQHKESVFADLKLIIRY